jgi:hypothetical protein
MIFTSTSLVERNGSSALIGGSLNKLGAEREFHQL